MRLSVAVLLGGILMMAAGYFTQILSLTSVLFGTLIFSLGLIVSALGIALANRDIESALLRLELESRRPSPEDIRRRPLRRPRP